MTAKPQIYLNYYTLFYIDAMGKVSAWGLDSSNLCDIPADLPPVKSIAAAAEYVIALCYDGTIRAWGDDADNVNTKVKHLQHITPDFGITIDGQVVRLVPFQKQRVSITTPEGKYKNIVFKDQLPKSFAKPVVRLWEFNEHVYAIHPDGTMTSWQESYRATPNNEDTMIPNDLPLLKDFTPHVKLYNDGRLAGWNNDAMVAEIAAIPYSDFVELSYFFALRANGDLVPLPKLIDKLDAKKLSHSSVEPKLLRKVPTGLRNVIQLNSDGHSMVALTRDGRVAVWGKNIYEIDLPLPVNDSNIADIVAGRDMVVIRYVDGSVKVWNEEFKSFSEVISAKDARIVDMAANLRLSEDGQWYHQYILLDDQGRVHVDQNRLELEFLDKRVHPKDTGYITPAAVQGNTTAVFVDLGNVYAVQKDPTIVYAWGRYNVTVMRESKPVKQIVGDGHHTVILYQDGTIRMDYGEAPPHELQGVTAVAASDTHTLALLHDGTVVAWGDNQLGACDVPADLANVVAITAGEDYSVALLADGTIRGWGENGEGQYAFPADLPKVRQVKAAIYQTYVLTESGSVIKSHHPTHFDVPEHLRV
jgi:Regulator of chromosome condensation (RCC1) repeat